MCEFLQSQCTIQLFGFVAVVMLMILMGCGLINVILITYREFKKND